MSKQSNLTVKGQVTIPKDVRDALGLKAGEPVEFDWNDGGEVVIRKGSVGEAERRRLHARALVDIERAVAQFPMVPVAASTDEYMAMIRERVPVPRDA